MQAKGEKCAAPESRRRVTSSSTREKPDPAYPVSGENPQPPLRYRSESPFKAGCHQPTEVQSDELAASNHSGKAAFCSRSRSAGSRGLISSTQANRSAPSNAFSSLSKTSKTFGIVNETDRRSPLRRSASLRYEYSQNVFNPTLRSVMSANISKAKAEIASNNSIESRHMDNQRSASQNGTTNTSVTESFFVSTKKSGDMPFARGKASMPPSNLALRYWWNTYNHDPDCNAKSHVDTDDASKSVYDHRQSSSNADSKQSHGERYPGSHTGTSKRSEEMPLSQNDTVEQQCLAVGKDTRHNANRQKSRSSHDSNSEQKIFRTTDSKRSSGDSQSNRRHEQQGVLDERHAQGPYVQDKILEGIVGENEQDTSTLSQNGEILFYGESKQSSDLATQEKQETAQRNRHFGLTPMGVIRGSQDGSIRDVWSQSPHVLSNCYAVTMNRLKSSWKIAEANNNTIEARLNASPVKSKRK